MVTKRPTHPALAPTHTNDPATSTLAAEQVNVSRQMFLVLEALAHHSEPITNDEIHAWSARRSAHYRGDYPHALSTRRGKLQDLGLVTLVDHAGKSRAGRACSRYLITTAGRDAFRVEKARKEARA